MKTDKQLQAAEGYLDLGMHQDAWDELENLPMDQQHLPDVLALQAVIFLKTENWHSARTVYEHLTSVMPGNAEYWLKLAAAVRHDESVQAAYTILLTAIERHDGNAELAFRTACYGALSGDMHSAKLFLKRSIQLDPGYKEKALDDPELSAMWDYIWTG